MNQPISDTIGLTLRAKNAREILRQDAASRPQTGGRQIVQLAGVRAGTAVGKGNLDCEFKLTLNRWITTAPTDKPVECGTLEPPPVSPIDAQIP